MPSYKMPFGKHHQADRDAVSVVEKRRKVAAIKRRDEKAARFVSDLHVRKAAEAARFAYRSDKDLVRSATGRPKAVRRTPCKATA